VLLDMDALRREDRGRIWSNLDKVDPEIVVYRRVNKQQQQQQRQRQQR
jgi:hypothetical protein